MAKATIPGTRDLMPGEVSTLLVGLAMVRNAAAATPALEDARAELGADSILDDAAIDTLWRELVNATKVTVCRSNA